MEAPHILEDIVNKDRMSTDKSQASRNFILKCRVTVLNEELARMSPDIAAIEAYRKKETDYQNRAQELESATAERDEVCIRNLTFETDLGVEYRQECVTEIS